MTSTTTLEGINTRIEQIDRWMAVTAESIRTATVDQGTKGIYRYVAELAKLEGEYEVYSLVQRVLENGKTIQDAADVITRKLIQGADDTWSGRGNDLARTRHDGLRSAADYILSAIQYGSAS